MIGPLTEVDRADWEAAVRAYHRDAEGTLSDEVHDRAWSRLLDGTEICGVAARVDGAIAGFAHYCFHTGVWAAGDSAGGARRPAGTRHRRQAGVEQPTRHPLRVADLEQPHCDTEQHGATLLHWHTREDNAARALYDKVAEYTGYISYRRKL